MEDNNEILDINIDELFNDTTNTTTNNNSSEDMTKAVSERINTVRQKTEIETQNKIAKELGYENYEAMRKANEKQMLQDAGINEEEMTEVVNKLVEQRIANDPRFKRLEEIELAEKNKFITSQLKEINNLTGSNYNSLEQLPKDTLEMFEKIGNLSQAYFATQGASLFNKNQVINKNGGLKHLADSSVNSVNSRTRPLTSEEKAIYKMVNPDLTDEELAKKTVNINDD